MAGTLHGPGDPARIAACEPVSAHTVRRSFAANLLGTKDVPFAAISKALGHSKIATAMRYLRVDVWACGALRFSPGAAASDCLPGLATDRIPGISSYIKEKALNISAFKCPGQDSNLHERNCSLPPQSSVSTNFTTWADLPFPGFGVQI